MGQQNGTHEPLVSVYPLGFMDHAPPLLKVSLKPISLNYDGERQAPSYEQKWLKKS